MKRSNEFRNDLLTRMIHIYGFEHPLVIEFAEMCEKYTSTGLREQWDNCLEMLVEAHEREPQYDTD